MKKHIKIIFDFIMTIVVAVVLLFALLNFFSGPDKNGLFGYKGYIVLSDSMKPTFSTGDYIIDELPALKEIQVGDVLSYMDTDKKVVTHRVAEITEEGLMLKGDGNSFLDQTIVNQENYIGKQRYVIPKLGAVMVKLSQPLMLVIISLLFLGLLIYQKLRNN
ncbi:signal peptidase I [Enterococcus lemanii]|uniref:Signal peptidase I n=1 Tax=Enterococcus lemanii TaxID=1159752 RepID=A0ABV9MU31_9ENTE|nr:signal peptidase I [Enterococcus lemanii]